MVNYEKTLIYFWANVQESERDMVSNHLKVRVSTNLENYLGLLMMVSRNKRRVFNSFVDRIRNRLENWNLCFLSMGGKEVLIKAVL